MLPHLKHWGFIKDPLYGYIHFTKAEKDVIDTLPVQRLRMIRQLAGAEYVYPGAHHTRLEHSLGVMHLAGKLAQNLSEYMNAQEVEAVRMAGLLHDVGHGPFSHVFEHLLVKYLEKTHEDLTPWIVSKSELADVIEAHGHSPERIGDLAAGRMARLEKPFLNQIIRSAVDVDKMDFIVRDTYHTGAEYGFIDTNRLIYTIDILDGNLAVDVTSLAALESLMIARVESFKTIYFHRATRAAQVMLVAAMEAAREELGLIDFKSPDEYLDLNDYTLWTWLKQCEASKPIIKNLERRRLLKCVYDRTLHIRNDLAAKIFSSETTRKQIADEVAEKAEVEPETITIDVPTLPSVPYRHSMEMRPMDIPVFSRTRDGSKKTQSLSDISMIITSLRGYLNIIRIYTREDLREKVAVAAEKVLGTLPETAEISY
ncbi:MAG: HD domain-containing protein [Nitrososphaeria archaeon]|nr:HD domain-containing protein [Nitrososphaeria archaeon]